jgi:hypothetical protein
MAYKPAWLLAATTEPLRINLTNGRGTRTVPKTTEAQRRAAGIRRNGQRRRKVDQ